VYGTPGVFNSDQGSQFTSGAFLSVLGAQGIQISKDGVYRALDDIFIERTWLSLKYKDSHVNSYESLLELKIFVRTSMVVFPKVVLLLEKPHVFHVFQHGTISPFDLVSCTG
jgi:transposase InsO family protein